MGLDIAFNREKAIAAGMVLYSERNGTDREIEAAKDSDDVGYQQYLEDVTEWVRVPYTDHSISNGGVDEIVVRANRWGNSYEPLTRWLKEKDITWTEF